MSTITRFNGTISGLRASIEREIANGEARIASARAEIEEMCSAAEAENRGALSHAQDVRADALFADIQKLKAANGRQQARLDRARQVEAEEDEYDRLSRISVPTSAARSRGTATVSVGRNERQYHQGKDIDAGFKNQPGGAFLLDVARSHLGDPMATDRLTRHMREEYVERPWLEARSTDTTNFTGLVVPQYLVEQAAPAVSAARPLADAMTAKSLPEIGMTVNLARITTPTAAGIQATQNTTVTTQDIDDTLLTLNVQTAAGYSQLSRQAIERGILTEDVTTTDLLTRVAVALDVQLLGQASVGLAASATSQTYTNATVDTTAIPTFLKQVVQAENTVETNLLSAGHATHAIMHPRRFRWMTAAVSANFPVLSGISMSPYSQGVQLTNEYGPAVRGVLADGLKIVADGNVTTVGLATALTGGTQDHCYLICADQSFLYEPPQRTVMIRAEQPQATQLGILFVAYEYWAATFQRYTGQSVLINGTGLATPSFA